MKRTILILAAIAAIVSVAHGGATSYNIVDKPTNSWWSGDASKDLGWLWMKAADNILTDGLTSLGKGTGTYFYVDSGTGSSSYDGLSWTTPKATIAQAIALCTANNGDVIWVAQGHSETVGSATACKSSTAGITIIGLGEGSLRPALNVGTLNTAVVHLNAANNIMANMQILCALDGVTTLAKVSGDYSGFVDCYFGEGGTDGDMNGTTAVTIGVADGDSDHAFVKRCEFYMPDATAWAQAVLVAKDMVDLDISENRIVGDFSAAGIEIPTAGNACVNARIVGNYVKNTETGDHAVEIAAGCSGLCARNYVVTDDRTTSIQYGGLAGNGLNHWADLSALNDGPVTLRAAKVSVAATTTGATSLFTVRGDPVIVTSIVGRVTAALHADVDNMKLMVNPDDGAIAEADLTGLVDASSAAIGNTFQLGGPQTALLLVKTTTGFAFLGSPAITDPCDNGYGVCGSNQIYIPPGTIRMNLSGAGGAGGAITWYITYIPTSDFAWVDPAS